MPKCIYLCLCAALLIPLAATDPAAALTIGIQPGVGNHVVGFSAPGSSTFTSSFSTSAQGGSGNPSRSMAYDQQGRLNILFFNSPNSPNAPMGGGFIERWDVGNQTLLSSNPISNIGPNTNLAVGANGNLYFGTNIFDSLSQIAQNRITEYNPLTGVSSSFVTGDAINPSPTTPGAFGSVAGAAFDQQGHLNVLFNPSNANTGGFIERWDVTNQTLLSTSFSFDAGAQFSDMVAGPDGRLYFASRLGLANVNRLNAFDPLTKQPLPCAG